MVSVRARVQTNLAASDSQGSTSGSLTARYSNPIIPAFQQPDLTA